MLRRSRYLKKLTGNRNSVRGLAGKAGRWRGFTIIELIVAIALATIISLTAFTVFNNLLNQYFGLQKNGTQFTELAIQSQRVANVLRGITGVVSAAPSDLVAYAYFSPSDTYVSQVHYYLNGSSTILLADVTPMTANPPIGVPVTSQMKTHTIIDNYYKTAGLNLFDYLDTSSNPLVQPISDLKAIKGLKINLAVPADNPTPGGKQQMSLQISLRNGKTNL